jgi:hypothetical protein
MYRNLFLYGLTWLAWGAVAQSQIGAYSLSFSLALLLSLGTSLFTLVALGPKSYASVNRKNKAELEKLEPTNLFKLFTDTLQVSLLMINNFFLERA